MNILSMLVRLQSTLGRSDLVNQMVLLPKAHALCPSVNHEINLVVGYSGSPSSQTALDLTLWIAHQTRLATGKQVTVQVVFVVDDKAANKVPLYCPTESIREIERRSQSRQQVSTYGGQGADGGLTAVVEPPNLAEMGGLSRQFGMTDIFEQADRILWQARCLADEWRGSLKTHLRFGWVAEELLSVVKAESASLLILGCESDTHRLVRQLGKNVPCPVLGIPAAIEPD